jgi:hypothetical protein
MTHDDSHNSSCVGVGIGIDAAQKPIPTHCRGNFAAKRHSNLWPT